MKVDYCNLRFDDTNPEKEEQDYVDAIKKMLPARFSVEWDVRYASNYFPKFMAMRWS